MPTLGEITAILSLLITAFGVGRVTKRTGAIASVTASNDLLATEYRQAMEAVAEARAANRELLGKVADLEDALSEAQRSNHRLQSQLGRAQQQGRKLSEQLEATRRRDARRAQQLSALAAALLHAPSLPAELHEAAEAVVNEIAAHDED